MNIEELANVECQKDYWLFMAENDLTEEEYQMLRNQGFEVKKVVDEGFLGSYKVYVFSIT